MTNSSSSSTPGSPDTISHISIFPGAFFSSWTALKEDVQNWAIAEHFAFNVPIKDLKPAEYRCRDRKTGCPWRIFASLTKLDGIKIKKVESKHTCAGSHQTVRDIANSQSWLRRTIPLHLFVTRDTKVREIVECMQMHYGVKVNSEAARITRALLIKDRLEHQCEQFRQIPAYLALLHSKNPFLYTDLHTIDSRNGEQAFQRVFICPAQSQLSFIQMRKFMAVDSTFLKARFIQTLLLAVGIDANGHNLLLAWAVVEGECTDSWSWFLNHLKQAIPQALKMTLISDRDKGLLAADAILGSGVNRLICCFHLKCNFVKRYRGVEGFFWPIANAKTHEEFMLEMDRLRQTNESAANYLASIDLTLWVTSYFSGQSFGHKTSNVVESMNNVLKNERELSILDLLNEIWHLTMVHRFNRLTEASKCIDQRQIYTDFCLQQLSNSQKWARKNTVQMSSEYKGRVNQANDRVYIVDLEHHKCDCGHFQENGIPCGHAFSCIYHLGQSPRDYVPSLFTVQTWKNTYLSNLEPITLDDLPQYAHLPLPACIPPEKLRAPAGRPRTVRLTPGSRKKYVVRAQAVLNNEIPPPERGPGSQSCRLCGNYGHNRKTCPERNVDISV